MAEITINSTHTLWNTHGVVHISGIDYEGNEINIEYDALQLLQDIPHLYEQAIIARDKEDKRIKEQYKMLKQKL
jgi:hypothetical protein